MFTLIAYRSNGYCFSGSQTNSDLEISYHESTDSLATEFVKFKKREFEHRDYREFENYDFTILQNGRDLYDINYGFHQEMFDELNAIAHSSKAEWQQAEDDEKAQVKLKAMQAQRNRDLQELARIHARLGITG